jgi:hypothetical protein
LDYAPVIVDVPVFFSVQLLEHEKCCIEADEQVMYGGINAESFR